MAIVHEATVSPTKLELITSWLESRPWAGAGEVERLGSYRFDDPAGEVGIEGLLLSRGGAVLHVPLTYRSAPLSGGEAHLIGTMQHSVLGERWVYDATGDPVALECYRRGLAGEQGQAPIEVWSGGKLISHAEPDVTLRTEAGGVLAVSGTAVTVEADGARLSFARVLGVTLDGPQQLVAEWPGGRAVVVAAELG